MTTNPNPLTGDDREPLDAHQIETTSPGHGCACGARFRDQRMWAEHVAMLTGDRAPGDPRPAGTYPSELLAAHATLDQRIRYDLDHHAADWPQWRPMRGTLLDALSTLDPIVAYVCHHWDRYGDVAEARATRLRDLIARVASLYDALRGPDADQPLDAYDAVAACAQTAHDAILLRHDLHATA